MPDVEVVIPWRPGCPWRHAALNHVRRGHLAAGRSVTIGIAPSGPWCKATATQAAIDRTAADLLVVADADVWTDGLDQAIDVVATGRVPWAIPHGHVHRLTPAATVEVLSGRPPHQGLALDEQPYHGTAGGGIVVLTREAWATAPLDRRFEGWGQEDRAWALALTTLVGKPWRGSAPLWHLWHPPQDRPSRREGQRTSQLLHSRYHARRKSPARMATLVTEGSPHGRHSADDPDRDPPPAHGG